MTAASAGSPKGWLRPHPFGCTLSVRIQPGAKRSAILGLHGEGEALRIAIQAPPIEGRANAALISFLTESLDIPKSQFELLSGESSRSKSILLHGQRLETIRESFQAWL